MIRTVCIDPGHGGVEPGAVALDGQHEANLVLPFAHEIGASLARRGHKVLFTRHADVAVPLSMRAKVANDAKADLFLSVHLNASGDPKANGPWTIYAKGSRRGQEFATAVQAALSGVLGGRIGAVYPDGSEWVGHRTLAVLRQTKAPAILLELGFLTNAADLKQLQEDDTPKCVAEAVAAAVDGIL